MYLGGDLSYVNEVEDKGGSFFDKGQPKDVFAILKAHGATIARVRLWHTPLWTTYSNFADVQKTIRRAKTAGMAVLLDFHYSDTWADPAKQIIPKAWAEIDDLPSLGQALYDYTFNTLVELDQQHLMPDFVQVGNEINTELIMPEPYAGGEIHWERNAVLLQAGIKAVREAGVKANIQPQVMLHIAQPENIIPWFDDALAAGISDFDVIGMSYYPKWSVYSLQQAGELIGKARERFKKDLMVVETAYPWTNEPGTADSHLLAEDALLPDYPATPQGQRQFLIDLTRTTHDNGGNGVIYWEPAWISTPQSPSIWENAALFDYQHNVHEGIEFLSHSY